MEAGDGAPERHGELPGTARRLGFEVTDFFVDVAGDFESLPAVFGGGELLAMGRDMPRSLPLLATPTPHVRVVRYPEQSFPISKHCVQYGLLRSHLVLRFRHVKQSSAAPVAGALLRLFRGTAALETSSAGFSAVAGAGAEDMFTQ